MLVICYAKYVFKKQTDKQQQQKKKNQQTNKQKHTSFTSLAS